jgi:hypothetical protein
VALRTVTFLYNHDHLFLNSHILPNWNLYPLNMNSHFSSPQLLEAPIILSVSMNLTTPATSYEWSRSVVVLLWQAYCIWCGVFKVLPCYSACPNFRSSLSNISSCGYSLSTCAAAPGSRRWESGGKIGHKRWESWERPVSRYAWSTPQVFFFFLAVLGIELRASHI